MILIKKGPFGPFFCEENMKALKPFIDCNQNLVKRGDDVKQSDYRKDVWNSYLKKGLVAAPKNKKAEPPKNKAKKGNKK